PCLLSHHSLRSFPTRRSSDLGRSPCNRWLSWPSVLRDNLDSIESPNSSFLCIEIFYLFICPSARFVWPFGHVAGGQWQGRLADRSEEHTSELQSRFDLVCRLL